MKLPNWIKNPRLIFVPIAVLCYVAAKVYVSSTPSPVDDQLLENIKEAIVMVVNVDDEDSSEVNNDA